MSSATESGVAAVTRFLDEAGVSYELVEHPPTFSALDEARTTGTGPSSTAKTLLLHDRVAWRLAVLPATRRLDMPKVRRLLDAGAHLRLATEEEMGQEFPTFEIGALPPFGPLVGSPEVVDVRLLYRERILCPAGDHRHCALLDPRELIRLVEPRVGDICERVHPDRRKDFEELPHV